jgi:3-oxoacyl-[acyl-carrier-protein] synthase II
MGVVSATGVGVPRFWASLVAGESGVKRLPFAAEVVGACVELDPSTHFTPMQLTTLDRFAQFALVAGGEACKEAKLDREDFAGVKAGVYFGSGLGGANTIESSYRTYLGTPPGRVGPMTVVLTMANGAAAQLSLRYGIRGPTLTYSVACASAAVAIGEAFRALRDGYIDVALVGGSEALLASGIVAGWSAMRVLATPDAAHPEQSCRPFSRNRSGLVLGEGAAVLVLETFENADKRGVDKIAEIAGYGIASDAVHLVKPQAEGQVEAMRAALHDADIPPEAIEYVNAHGTATPIGDVVETESVKQVFGTHARDLAVSSTKAVHGHLLGASGAVELVAAIMPLRTSTLPPTAHLSEPDPQCDLDYVPNEARRDCPVATVMSNSFAFGGTNAVLVARAV